MALASNSTLVEIHRDRLSRDALVGRVRQVSTHVILIERLDELYRQDGVAAVRVADITRMRTGTRELETGAFIEGSLQPWEAFPEVAMLEISSAITFFQRRFGHVVLHTERLDPQVCFIGEVIDLDDDVVVLHEFGTFKTRDRGELVLALNEVTHAMAGGAYEARLMRMYKPGPSA